MKQYLRKPENGNPPVRRELPSEYRSRRYLTLDEVTRLIEAAKVRGRYRTRNEALLLMMFRHGLRVSEAAMMQWDAVMLAERQVVIHRGRDSQQDTHPLQADEVVVLEALRAAYPNSTYLFPDKQGDPITKSVIGHIVWRCSTLAELPLLAHAKMLRPSCAHHLLIQGIDPRLVEAWLGLASINHSWLPYFYSTF